MEQAIRDFATQFLYEPVIENKERLKKAERYVLMGMGGSHLAADIIRSMRPDIALTIHEDYDLPHIPLSDVSGTLFIASSYSGNTEEVMSGLEKAVQQSYNVVCIAVGGKLIEFAQTHHLPYIQLPNTGIQPRSALGYSMVALAAVIEGEAFAKELHFLAEAIKPEQFETQGKQLAETLSGYVPLIYASRRNQSIAYNWKIKFNETGKIPAFYNIFPELNHNEMTGFDIVDSTRSLSEKLFVIFITDPEDHPQIQKRMQVCKELYAERGIETITLAVVGETCAEKIFNSLLLADWTAYHTALRYGTEPEQVPMVEDFKERIS